MNAKIHELMTRRVVTTQPHATIGHARTLLARNKIHALPVVDSEGRPVGIVSSADLMGRHADGSPVHKIMTEKVHTVAQYEEVSVAARIMRNRRIHHVVVTREQKVVGMITSFDLLKLVEDRRFVMKNPPTRKKRGIQPA
jgi:CBS domain-containing protein